MENINPIKFNRSKGIVWVCDIAKSSSYLNDNVLVDDIEKFIPRLYYISKLLVESYGGIFMKWTGDGFLAFFELDLDRHKEDLASKIFDAAWRLTFLSNVTQLGLKPTKSIKIRHGIAYEPDALMMRILDQNPPALDIIGRSVVLAFRLSGIQANFPSIVTTHELVGKSSKFKKWQPNSDERLKFFKGEKFGVNGIYVSTSDRKINKSKGAGRFLKDAKNLIAGIEKKELTESDKVLTPHSIFSDKMHSGPDWCREIIDAQLKFLDVEMFGTIKKMVRILETARKKAPLGKKSSTP